MTQGGFAHEVAQIRRALRDMLWADRYDQAPAVLDRFARVAGCGDDDFGDPELTKEYERWRARLAILAATI